MTDWTADGLPPASHQELAREYGPTSQAAKDGNQRYFVSPSLSFRYLALNTSRPLFSNLKLRQAVQYAINRPALLAQRGAYAGQPTDQYLPPGVPGYVDENIYPINGPDLRRPRSSPATSTRRRSCTPATRRRAPRPQRSCSRT